MKKKLIVTGVIAAIAVVAIVGWRELARFSESW